MAYEETLGDLFKRAAEVEAMEGTIHYTYTTRPDDVMQYTVSAKKNFFVLLIVVVVFSLALLIVGFLVKDILDFQRGILIGFAVSVLVLYSVFTVFYFIGMNKVKKNDHTEEVKLAFNAYGIVMRVCSDVLGSVYVYRWNEFDSLVEYDRVVAAQKKGIIYLFPKRVFSMEEFEKFRNFSYAGAGKKCLYKKFKK